MMLCCAVCEIKFKKSPVAPLSSNEADGARLEHYGLVEGIRRNSLTNNSEMSRLRVDTDSITFLSVLSKLSRIDRVVQSRLRKVTSSGVG